MLNMYSVLDSKTESYGSPFSAQTNASAIRDFTTVANNKETQIGAHPEDFCLVHLGSFDPHTGTIDVLPVPAKLGLASHFIQQ